MESIDQFSPWQVRVRDGEIPVEVVCIRGGSIVEKKCMWRYRIHSHGWPVSAVGITRSLWDKPIEGEPPYISVSKLSHGRTSRTDRLAHPRKWGYENHGIRYPHDCLIAIWMHDFLGSLNDLPATPSAKFVPPDRGNLIVDESAQKDASASHLASETLGPRIRVNGPLEDEGLR